MSATTGSLPMRQASIEVEGLSHASAPIPLACRVGPVLATSGIGGRDAATGDMPPDAATQAVNCFANLQKVLAQVASGSAMSSR